MSDKDEKVEIHLETSKNKKKIKLTIISTRPMDTHDFVVVLEDYLQDLYKEYKAMPDNEAEKH